MMSTWCEPVPCISGNPPSVIYWRRIELLMLRQRALQLYLPDMVPIFLQHLQAHSSANPVAFSFMFCVEVSNLKGSGGNCLVLRSLSSIYEMHHAPEQGKIILMDPTAQLFLARHCSYKCSYAWWQRLMVARGSWFQKIEGHNFGHHSAIHP